MCVFMRVEAGGQPWVPLFRHYFLDFESGSLSSLKFLHWVWRVRYLFFFFFYLPGGGIITMPKFTASENVGSGN